MSLRRKFLWACVVVSLGAGMEFFWFQRIIYNASPALKADVLAVFGGPHDRYVSGWRLEKQGEFRYLVFSDESMEEISAEEKVQGAPKMAEILPEPNARTTAQNARFVERLMVQYHCNSVVIVTSWWHLPRAILLMQLATCGTGTRIEGISCDIRASLPWTRPELWLEFLKVPGSLLTYFSDSRKHQAAA